VQRDYNGNSETFLLNQDIVIGNPKNFNLDQNFPNPFNPVTSISFDLPEPQHIIIRVYDILGRQVSELVNKEFTAGYHTEIFDGTGLASGIYYYSLFLPNGSSLVKKMTIVK
jgi:hypothetical protein